MIAGHGRKLGYLLGLTTLVGVPYAGVAQDTFPEGPARDTIFLVCTQCHPLTRITDGDLSAAEWEFTLYDMIARGAPVHADDVEIVRRYLIENFSNDD